MAEVRIKNEEILSNSHYVLKKVNFDLKKKNGEWESQEREVYDHGNAVTVLLYNKQQKTIILTKQFRIASYLNNNAGGMLVETCAGLLEENENPDEAIKREIEEETGYKIEQVERVFEAYMSAGSLTELLYFYLAPYSKDQKVSRGGGLEEEQEEIYVLEIPFSEAIAMMKRGEIKDSKTIILLQYALINELM
jgi:nudix-type nucleoside diphosphatase (YffH/AdpP family)